MLDSLGMFGAAAGLPEQIERASQAASAVGDLPEHDDIENVVVLGMGEDGHTASWLPHAEGLAETMHPGARQLVAAVEATGPYEPRLTLTGRVILRARAIALHIEGQSKLRALAAALEDGPEEEMPVRAVLRGGGERLTVFSAARS